MRLLLVDLHGALADAAALQRWPGDVRAWTDLKDVPEAYRAGCAVISPANSLGFMDGGVDYVISRVMFPGVEGALRAALAARGVRTDLGRPWLRIGEALVVPVPVPVPVPEQGAFLIAAPTMWLPQDVRGTHNAYHATYAAIAEARRHGGIHTLVFPGMGTGCGMLTPDEALGQMSSAARDALEGRPPRWDAAQIARQQPRVYMNIEFEPGIRQDMIAHA